MTSTDLGPRRAGAGAFRSSTPDNALILDLKWGIVEFIQSSHSSEPLGIGGVYQAARDPSRRVAKRVKKWALPGTQVADDGPMRTAVRNVAPTKRIKGLTRVITLNREEKPRVRNGINASRGEVENSPPPPIQYKCSSHSLGFFSLPLCATTTSVSVLKGSVVSCFSFRSQRKERSVSSRIHALTTLQLA